MRETYLSQPDGDWGMVFTADIDRTAGSPVLVCIAFGRRHPLQTWQLSVFRVAHRSLDHRARVGRHLAKLKR